jgi:hypothetical protein
LNIGLNAGDNLSLAAKYFPESFQAAEDFLNQRPESSIPASGLNGRKLNVEWNGEFNPDGTPKTLKMIIGGLDRVSHATKRSELSRLNIPSEGCNLFESTFYHSNKRQELPNDDFELSILLENNGDCCLSLKFLRSYRPASVGLLLNIRPGHVEFDRWTTNPLPDEVIAKMIPEILAAKASMSGNKNVIAVAEEALQHALFEPMQGPVK